MTASLWWIAGFLLLAGELLTGTFYLLILGATALLSGIASYFGCPAWGQWLLASGLATAGCLVVNRFKKAPMQAANTTQNLDAGQAVRLLEQLDGTHLRVHYRGADWQARLDSPCAEAPATLYILHVEANTLIVGCTPPNRP